MRPYSSSSLYSVYLGIVTETVNATGKGNAIATKIDEAHVTATQCERNAYALP